MHEELDEYFERVELQKLKQEVQHLKEVVITMLEEQQRRMLTQEKFSENLKAYRRGEISEMLLFKRLTE